MSDIIRNKQDAINFVKGLPVLDDDQSSFDGFQFIDSRISMPGGGTTAIYLDKDGQYYQYSSGKNWWVWKNRKDINKALRDPLWRYPQFQGNIIPME